MTQQNPQPTLPKLKGFKSYPPRLAKVSELKQDPNNVNAHSDLDLNATGNSLEAFGQVETLVVDYKTKIVIGGNGRLEKMTQKGWEDVWIIEVEGDPDQLKTLGITLNETTRLSGFDYTKLSAVLQDLQHASDQSLLALTGIPQHEFEILLGAEVHMPESSNTLVDDDGAAPTPAKTEHDSTKMASRGFAIQFTREQRTVVEEAIDDLKKELDSNLTPSEALTEICRRHLSVPVEA